jgi:uncharacterized membrane protein
MKPIILETHIHAPVSRVFGLATDIPNVPSVIPGITRVELLSEPGHTGLGTRWRETRKVMGKEATVVIEITSLEVDKHCVMTCFMQKTRYDTRFDFAAHEAGTQVKMTTTAEAPGFFSKLFAAMMGGMMKKGLEDDLQALKRAAEKQS